METTDMTWSHNSDADDNWPARIQ